MSCRQCSEAAKTESCQSGGLNTSVKHEAMLVTQYIFSSEGD